MELPFKYLPMMRDVISEPMTILVWAGLGIPIVLIVLSICAMLFLKKESKAYDTPVYRAITVSLVAIWIAGFAITMVLFFASVSGEKLYLIWILLVVTVSIFVTVNISTIFHFLEETAGGRKSRKN